MIRGGQRTAHSGHLKIMTSFDEVIISIFVSGGLNATLTKHMFAALRDFIDPTIAAISTIMILISSILLLATQYIGNRDKPWISISLIASG